MTDYTKLCTDLKHMAGAYENNAPREALRLLGVDPDSIAREAEKEAQNG